MSIGFLYGNHTFALFPTAADVIAEIERNPSRFENAEMALHEGEDRNLHRGMGETTGLFLLRCLTFFEQPIRREQWNG